MPDPVDPRRLPQGYKPAIVTLWNTDDRDFVASAEPMDGGWLRMTGWQGSISYLPQDRVYRVDRLERERYLPDGENQYTLRLSDPERRADALEAAGLQDDAEVLEADA